MADNREKIDELIYSLDILMKKQSDFSKEINELRFEINKLKNSTAYSAIERPSDIINQPGRETIQQPIKEATRPVYQYQQPKRVSEQPVSAGLKQKLPGKSDIEKFIGENLINKIGIAITIIGVAIGAKYSIEHGWISPLTRIIFGYLMGLGLLGFGIKLKLKYESFSAVLVSGAIAIMYFITYAAYDFYELIPQSFAFGLMVLFTAFTVVAAINYNKQIIAHIGLVGAYAVPFLLSDGSGKVLILFSYMAIINIGILVISFKRYWKLLYYSSFILTWLVFSAWFTSKYDVTQHYLISFVFITIYFITFYLIFLAYKLIRKEKFDLGDVLLLLANSFIFYGMGYSILGSNQTSSDFNGLFTLCNAIIHFGVSVLIYKQKLADKNLFFLLAGLVLVFITITIPIQLDGNWVTLLWACEAVLLFWIGRTNNVGFYEKTSYPLMFIAFISIVLDWTFAYDIYSDKVIKPIFNVNFLSSFLFIAGFSFLLFLKNKRKRDVSIFENGLLTRLANNLIPVILLIVAYFSFSVEISYYWEKLHYQSFIQIKNITQDYPDSIWNEDLSGFKTCWLLIYSLLFFSILSFINIYKVKSHKLGVINLAINVLCIVAFLTSGLLVLSELRDTYIHQTLAKYFYRGSFNITIRYISFAFVGLVLFATYKYIQQEFMKSANKSLKVAYDALLYVTILWILRSEMITWLSIKEFPETYKLGLSILWGIYAFLLTVLGIWKKKKHIRIGAIGLFAVTLLKLFLYDISELNTIAKTIVFVSLGLLLLIISFLYNKYKLLIADNNED